MSLFNSQLDAREELAMALLFVAIARHHFHKYLLSYISVGKQPAFEAIPCMNTDLLQCFYVYVARHVSTSIACTSVTNVGGTMSLEAICFVDSLMHYRYT